MPPPMPWAVESARGRMVTIENNISSDNAILRNIVGDSFCLFGRLGHGFANDFFDRGNACTNLFQTRFAQRNHAVFDRLLPQLDSRGADQYQLADLIGNFHHFVKADASLVTGIVTSGAALALKNLECL